MPAQVSDESLSMPTRGDVLRRYGGVDSSNEAASVVLDFEHDPMETLYQFVVDPEQRITTRNRRKRHKSTGYVANLYF